MTRLLDRQVWTRQKQERRAQREREFGAKITYVNAFRSTPLYGVIQTDDLDQATLPAAKNCVLFLWSSPEALLDALAQMDQWGFVYKSSAVWTKPCCDPLDPGALFPIRSVCADHHPKPGDQT
jgi:N6-adenosine-specific RNA methylase IME4